MKTERGFTLIELLIYSMLSIVVLTVVGGLLINSLRAERTVREITEANTTGQLVAQSLARGVRNASELRLDAPSADTLVLRARVVDNALTDAEHCEAWYYGDGELRTTRSASAIPVPSAPADVAGWTVLAEGAQPVGANPVFTAVDRTAELDVELAGGDEAPLLIETTVVSRQPAAIADVGSCF